MYQLLLLVHLLTVAAAFFAAGALLVLRNRIEAASTPREALGLLGTSKPIAMLMPILSVLLLVTGLALTPLRASYTDPWILLSIAGLVAMSVVGAAILKPRNAALAQALVSAPDLAAVSSQLSDPVPAIAEFANIALAVAIVTLMVVKPSLLGALAIVIGLPVIVCYGVSVKRSTAARATAASEYGS